DTFGVKLKLHNLPETEFLPGKKYYLRAMDSLNYVTRDTISEGGATQIISRIGTDVILSDGGGTVSIEDGDSDDTNEIDIMQAFTGSNTVRLIPSYNEFQITGSGGISVSSSTSSGATEKFAWNIDGSGITSSPWAGSYPDPYVSSGAANVGIGSTPNTSRLFINNSQPTDQSLDIDHYVGDNSTMVQVTNTRRGGSWYLFGGTDGVSMRMFNTGGSETFRLYGNGNILTTGSIATDGSIGTSSQVLFGGSNPA